MTQEDTENKRVDFILPEGITIVDVISEILKANDLEESSAESFHKANQNKDSRLMIVRNAAHLLVQKKIPENKLADFLAKHLPTKEHAASKIIKGIKEKLLPYAKIIDIEEEEKGAEKERRKREAEAERQKAKEQAERGTAYDKEAFREELLSRISRGRALIAPTEPEPKLPLGVRKPVIADVEKNAERIQRQRAPIASQPAPQGNQKPPEKKEIPGASQHTEDDPYRETL